MLMDLTLNIYFNYLLILQSSCVELWISWAETLITLPLMWTCLLWLKILLLIWAFVLICYLMIGGTRDVHIWHSVLALSWAGLIFLTPAKVLSFNFFFFFMLENVDGKVTIGWYEYRYLIYEIARLLFSRKDTHLCYLLCLEHTWK